MGGVVEVGVGRCSREGERVVVCAQDGAGVLVEVGGGAGCGWGEERRALEGAVGEGDRGRGSRARGEEWGVG